MIYHDKAHIKIINDYLKIEEKYNSGAFLSYKKLYYNILNFKDLNTIKKELLIFFLFITIHELPFKNYPTFDKNFNFLFKGYLDYFQKKFSTGEKIFLPELQKFYYNIKKYYNYDLINKYKISIEKKYPNIDDYDNDLIECLIYSVYMLRKLNNLEN